ncbi:MAG: DUF433 domain-containing protein [Synechococcaceae cyanobacterium SM2_3_2]|nr:DUF433 domain-containing protein [Synechococcaceae cyanobacterium SM2_3_2]
MPDQDLVERIEINPRVMGGKPVIQGTRLTVNPILHLLAAGSTVAEILSEYESLAEQDIRACLLFAARTLESSSFVPLGIGIA